ncbi:hypothetical protein ABBQ32_011523 [Trebouxia sp. C0010 RCD-2024]
MRKPTPLTWQSGSQSTRVTGDAGTCRICLFDGRACASELERDVGFSLVFLTLHSSFQSIYRVASICLSVSYVAQPTNGSRGAVVAAIRQGLHETQKVLIHSIRLWYSCICC